MSTMFDIDFGSDSSQEDEVTTKQIEATSNRNIYFPQSQSVMLKSDKKHKDKYVVNQISKNILFAEDDDTYLSKDEPQRNQSLKISENSPRKQPVTDKKSPRRVKVASGIKLQPLHTLQLVKNTQKISLIKPSQDQVKPFTKENIQSSGLQFDTYQKKNITNIEMGSSSEEQKHSHNESKQKTQQNKKSPKKLMIDLSSNVFFQDSSEQQNTKHQQKNTENQKSTQNKENQNVKEQSDSQQAKVGIQSEPNPQNGKKQINQPNHQIKRQNIFNENENKYEQKSFLDSVKCLLFQSMMKNSVINLRLKRKQTFLNLFSPEFRVEFHQDRYFIMNSKKTSSKPTSTFIFSASQINADQNSKNYLGKMKSNVSGSVYNIFGPGLNPSNAKERNKPPRELLATVCYKTQFMGTSKPKQLAVFVKDPQCFYYRDLRGTRIYDDEVPLNELYQNYPDNRQKIKVYHTRKPSFNALSKQYVMDFNGKVKVSSVKNFILEDRENNSEKVLLFGKVTQDQFVLDVHSPLAPIVGIGVALTVFDSRIGSD